MRSLFGRKKKDESAVADVEEPESVKHDLNDINENVIDEEENMFDGVESEDNGLFEGMETLGNNNALKIRTEDIDDEEYDEEDDDDDDEDDDVVSHPIEGMYDPAEFVDLPVGPEEKELFEYIIR